MVTFINSRSGSTISREDIKDEEFIYEGKALLVETDFEGIITYANRRFIEVSGYSKEEVIGSPHCMHIHPQMPEAIFKDACQMTSAGKTWSGYLRNISKEGIGYWTEAVIQPKFNDEGGIIGYMATRRAPDADKLESVMDEYDRLKEGNTIERSQYCGEVYLGRDACHF